MHSTLTQHLNQIRSAWEVLLLFLIPIGGGIPAGVLLAKSRGLQWPVMEFLYLISDVVLAFVFEFVMIIVVAVARKSPRFARVSEAFKKTMQKTTAHYGSAAGPLALILIAFGVDPMTGRAATAAAGHGFLVGWMLAITGDMLFFTLLMISTLWLNDFIGDATKTTAVILVVMMLGPYIVRRIRSARRR